MDEILQKWKQDIDILMSDFFTEYKAKDYINNCDKTIFKLYANDKEFIIKCINIHYLFFKYASDRLKNDYNLCLLVIENHPSTHTLYNLYGEDIMITVNEEYRDIFSSSLLSIIGNKIKQKNSDYFFIINWNISKIVNLRLNNIMKEIIEDDKIFIKLNKVNNYKDCVIILYN